MEKVYLVCSGVSYEYFVQGVWSSLEKAEEHIEALKERGTYAWWEAFQVDKLVKPEVGPYLPALLRG